MILDLGCGKTKREGTTGIDFIDMPGVDIVCNLNGELPLPDNSIEGVYASHILEHLDDIVFTMSEIWRVCKPDAWIKIWVPHFSSSTVTWGDPCHKRAFTIGTFEYFLPGRDISYIKTPFEIEDVRLNLNLGGGHSKGTKFRHRIYYYVGRLIENIVNRGRLTQKRFETRWSQFFPFSELYVQLRVIKNNRGKNE